MQDYTDEISDCLPGSTILEYFLYSTVIHCKFVINSREDSPMFCFVLKLYN